MNAMNIEKLPAEEEIGFYPSAAEFEQKTPLFNDGEDGLDNPPDNGRYKRQPTKQRKLDPRAIFKKVTGAEADNLAPEQSITLFAMRLAIVEKLASGIGTLAFIWASTIILGGFAANINSTDFIVVAIILTTEGSRIFSRGRELEWQRLASKLSRPDTSLQVLYEHSKSCNTFDSDSERIKNRKYSVGLTETGERPMKSFEKPRRFSEWEPEWLQKKRGRLSTSDCDSNQDQLKLRTHASDRAKLLNRSLASLNEKNVTFQFVDTSEEQSKSGPKSVRIVKNTGSSDVKPMLPGGMSKVLSNRGVSAVLCWVQLLSAIICLALSGWRISKQSFDPPHILRMERPVNLYMCVNLFYVLALVEAFMFILERGYWEYTINYQHLILKVSTKAGLGLIGQEIMEQFFYEVYKKCVEGNVFDGLEMDIVEFSLTLLQSENTFEQLGALFVLRKVVNRYDHFSADALRRIGTTPGAIERLVEMLSWQSSHHGDILQEAAALVCQSVRYSKNCIRIASVPGSLEMIVSLVKPSDRDQAATISTDKSLVDTLPSTLHNVSALRLDGLRILIAQARDPANLLDIGEARGLAPALVSLIAVKDVEQFKQMEGPELKTFKKVLRLLGMLVAARNRAGTVLRRTISRVVPCIASMRDILEFGDCHPQLQWMAIEVLTNLALDDDIRVEIGGTGGVIRNLLTLYIRDSSGSGYFSATNPKEKVKQTVSKRAGDALNFLTIQNQKNCLRMMELEQNGRREFIPAVVSLLNERREKTICAAKILRTLMQYANDTQQREIAVCAPNLLRILISSSNKKLLESVIGLASRVVGFLRDADYRRVVETVDRAPLIRKLLNNLDHDPQTFSSFPRIRRHTVECILALVQRDPIFLDEFSKDAMLERRLLKTLDSVCEVENFLTFSGSEGLTRHAISIEDLVQQTILELRLLLRDRQQSRNQFIIVHDD